MKIIRNVPGQTSGGLTSALFNLEGASPCGGLAQLVEHLLCKQGVTGSSPVTSTTSEETCSIPLPADAESSISTGSFLLSPQKLKGVFAGAPLGFLPFRPQANIVGV